MATKYRSRRARLAALAEGLRAQGQTWTQIARHIARDEHVNMRVAFRLAHGLSQRTVAVHWNERFPSRDGTAGMTDKVISYWESWPESGREPSLKSLKRLACLYQCSIGDLIEDGDYSHLDTAAAVRSREASVVAMRAASSTPLTQTTSSDTTGFPTFFGLTGENDEDAMKRRAFVLGLAAFGGLGALGPGMALESMRHDLNVLAERHTLIEVDDWHEIVLEYGHAYPVTAPDELLKALVVDLYGLQEAIGRYQDDTTQQKLRQVGAMLSAFTAQTIANLGYLREARRWWRTARQVADESQDRYTMLWIRGREIVRAGYERRPLSAILALIDEAEACMGSAPPVAALPEFLSGKAQTMALMGQAAHADTKATLAKLRNVFDALPYALRVANDSVFTWGEERLQFTESLTYTYLGDFRQANIAQDCALVLYPRDDFRSPAQIELQRALCSVASGDVLPGIGHAQAVITSLPAMHRVRPVADLGSKVLRAVPAADQSQSNVQEYRECLTASFAVPAPALLAREKASVIGA
jgi:hypothetical protein